MHIQAGFQGEYRPFIGVEYGGCALYAYLADKAEIQRNIQRCLETLFIDQEINGAFQLYNTGNRHRDMAGNMETLLRQVGERWYYKFPRVNAVNFFKFQHPFIIGGGVNLQQERAAD